MSLPIDRTSKTALDGNLANGNTSDAPVIKSSNDVVYNAIDEIYGYAAGLVQSNKLSDLKIINVKDYNASGSAQTTTGSITAGSKTLTLASAIDFFNGQGINVNGKIEVDNLQITAAATVSSNVTVTLNGGAFTVAVLAGDTIAQVATKIRNATYSGWTTGGTNDTITFTSTTTGTRTTPVYSAGTTTATGTMTVATQGSADLITTISSIAGTTIFTLAASATTTVTGITVSHDDTVAIQAATNYANSIGKKEIRMPSGTYRYGVLTNTSGITFIGDGVNLIGTTAITLTSISALKTDTTTNTTSITNLSSSKTDKTYVDTQISSVASGSPKGTYATVAALQTAFPTGNTNIYLVTADGKWYYWNGSAWTAGGVYQSTGIANNSVKATHIFQIPDSSVSMVSVAGTDINMFNKTVITPGYYVDASGVQTAYGSNVGGIGDYMPVNEGMTYTFSNDSDSPTDGVRLSGAWYDKNKTWLSTIANPTSPYPKVLTATAPANASYFRLNYTTSKLDTIICAPGSSLPTYVPYGVKVQWLRFPSWKISDMDIQTVANYTRFYGGKANFLGDSITAGTGSSDDAHRFYNLVKNTLGLSVSRNYGISGTLIAHDNTNTNAFVDRYSSMDNDADLVIVFGGTNDYYNGTGVLGAVDSTNTSEFYGALNVMMQGLITKYPSKAIIFVTPYNSYYVHSTDVINANSGTNLKGYRDAIKSRAEYYGIPVLDLYAMSGIDAAHNTTSRTTYTSDGLHPNDTGNALIANKLVGIIKSL